MTEATHTGDRRGLFLIEMDDGPDALLRALTPFAVHAARVVALNLSPQGNRLALRIETAAIDEGLAARLARKLDSLPIIRNVGLGWIG